MYIPLTGVLRLSSGLLFTLLSHLLQRHAPALCSGRSATMEFSNVWSSLEINYILWNKLSYLFFTFSLPFGVETVLLSFTALQTGEVFICVLKTVLYPHHPGSVSKLRDSRPPVCSASLFFSLIRRDMGKRWSKGTELQLHRLNNFETPNVQHGDDHE